MKQKSNGSSSNGSTPGNAQDSRHRVTDTNSGGNRHSPGGSNQSKILQTTATPTRPTGNTDKK